MFLLFSDNNDKMQVAGNEDGITAFQMDIKVNIMNILMQYLDTLTSSFLVCLYFERLLFLRENICYVLIN